MSIFDCVSEYRFFIVYEYEGHLGEIANYEKPFLKNQPNS